MIVDRGTKTDCSSLPFLTQECCLEKRTNQGGEGVSKEICGTVRLTSMTSCLASVTFKMASKVSIKETDKNFGFTTDILLRFLGFGDFKVSIVIEN